MRVFYFLFFTLLLYSRVEAQSGKEFTLEQAVQYALDNQTSVKNAQLDAQVAQARVGEVRSIGLPHITGSGQFVDNPALKRMFLQGGNPFLPLAIPAGEVLAIENVFQLRAAGDISLTASQIVFNGSYLVGLQAANTYKELSEKSVERAKEATVEAVNKAFYLVLVNRERMKLLDANLGRLDTLVNQTRVLKSEGFVEQIDVDRLEVTYNNVITEKAKFENLLQVSELLLKYQMGMPVQDTIIIAGSISSIPLDTTSLETNVNLENRIEYQLLQTSRKLQKINLKNERIGYLPTLAAFGSAGYFSQHPEFIKLYGNSKWYPYGMWGLNLSVPIFEGFGKMYKVKQARLQVEKSENDLYNLGNTIQFQSDQARIALSNNLKNLEAQSRNLKLAAEVTRVSKIKYQEGVGSNLELVTAETSYKEAQTNYYNALYDVIVARIDYQKATGTLYKP